MCCLLLGALFSSDAVRLPLRRRLSDPHPLPPAPPRPRVSARACSSPHPRASLGFPPAGLSSVTCECHLRVVLVVVVLWCCAAGSDRRRAVAIRAPVWCRTALFWCCQPWPGSWAPCCAVYLCFSGWCNLRAVSYPLPLSVFSSDIYICAIC